MAIVGDVGDGDEECDGDDDQMEYARLTKCDKATAVVCDNTLHGYFDISSAVSNVRGLSAALAISLLCTRAAAFSCLFFLL